MLNGLLHAPPGRRYPHVGKDRLPTPGNPRDETLPSTFAKNVDKMGPSELSTIGLPPQATSLHPFVFFKPTVGENG